MEVGTRIKERRKELGINVDRLAEILSISRATMYRYESGRISNLTIDFLVPLARALSTTPAYLMGWADSPDEGLLGNAYPVKVQHLPSYGVQETNMLSINPTINADFYIKVKDDSMIDARLVVGDIVFI